MSGQNEEDRYIYIKKEAHTEYMLIMKESENQERISCEEKLGASDKPEKSFEQEELEK